MTLPRLPPHILIGHLLNHLPMDGFVADDSFNQDAAAAVTAAPAAPRCHAEVCAFVVFLGVTCCQSPSVRMDACHPCVDFGNVVQRRAERVTVVLPRTQAELLDTTHMTLTELHARTAERAHSAVFVPLLCAAVGVQHSGVLLLSTLMGAARWHGIVSAVSTALYGANLQDIQWDATYPPTAPYVGAVVQDQLLFSSGVADAAIHDLMLFCASLR